MAATLLSLLLTLYPTMNHRACVVRRSAEIAAAVEYAYAEHGVPRAVVLAVAFHESHMGCDAASGGCWGVRHGRVPGTPDDAARALASSRVVCGSWRGAVGRFVSGLCRPWQPEHRAYVARVMSLAARLENSASAGALADAPVR